MFNFLKKKTQAPETTLLDRLKGKLSKTRKNFTDNLSALVLGKKTLDKTLLESLETRMLQADLGIQTTEFILNKLSDQLKRSDLSNPQAIELCLKNILITLLKKVEKPLPVSAEKKPFVLLAIGINGSGKTTTLAKIAQHFQAQGKKILFAAGDTFRAAAIEQLQTWGREQGISVIAQHAGADSASVIFDAMQAGYARNSDLILADTAGRLHTQAHLMAELKKVKKVISKLDSTAPHETLLVLDGSIGQNALIQARLFHQEIGVDGLVMTKLDGTAKGGMLFSIAQELALPIRYIGVGEQLDDLMPFNATLFVEALFGQAHSH